MKSASQLNSLIPYKNHGKLKPLTKKRSALELQALELLKMVKTVKEQERVIGELNDDKEGVYGSPKTIDIESLYLTRPKRKGEDTNN